MSASGDVVREYCLKWPKLPSRQLARLIYRDHKHLFPSLDAVRCAVRYARGNHGARSRRGRPTERPNQGPGLRLPPTLSKPWLPVTLGAERTLVMSDLHIPFHDRRAIESAVRFAKKWNPDCVLLNGDMADFYSISRFERHPTLVFLSHEIRRARQFLSWLRGCFPKARIVLKFGNHEERWERYLWHKAPELVGFESLGLDMVLKADLNDGVGALPWLEFVKDQRCILLGKLPVFHGHELGRSSIAPPVSAARGAFLRALHHVLIGHTHQHSTHTEKTIRDKLIICFSTGCLCDLHPRHARVNKWSHGFALVHTGRGGAFTVDNKRVVNGAVW